jgi:hypothetical protein
VYPPPTATNILSPDANADVSTPLIYPTTIASPYHQRLMFDLIQHQLAFLMGHQHLPEIHQQDYHLFLNL